MKKGRPIKATGIFNISIGIVNLASWTFLILTNKNGEFINEPISFVFHWASEFSTALLLILAGIQLLKRSPIALNMMFFSLGLLLMAIGGAFVYYLQFFNLFAFIFSTLITGASIILLILNFRSLKDFVYMTLGASVYGLLNILGSALQQNNISQISMALPSLLFLIMLSVSLINKEVVFRNLK